MAMTEERANEIDVLVEQWEVQNGGGPGKAQYFLQACFSGKGPAIAESLCIPKEELVEYFYDWYGSRRKREPVGDMREILRFFGFI